MPGVGRFGVAVRLIMLAFLTFAALATTACAVDQGPQEQDGQQQGEAPQQDEAQQQNGAGQENGDQQQEDTSSNGGDAQTGEATGEIYEVGPAGEVEIMAENGVLTLVEARPNEGWSIDDTEEESDEVEVEFQRGDEEWEFEAELEDGQVEIEIDSDTDD